MLEVALYLAAANFFEWLILTPLKPLYTSTKPPFYGSTASNPLLAVRQDLTTTTTTSATSSLARLMLRKSGPDNLMKFLGLNS